jgi:ADP-dependent NAD(P)H-hydrate dehydratase / NAD(P)H-hydrate epimerase
MDANSLPSWGANHGTTGQPTGPPRPTSDVGYDSAAMPAPARPSTPDETTPLPADDPSIFAMDLRGLRARWSASAALPAISAQTMTGMDRRAQALGVPELRLMEHAGTAVAAAVKALATDLERWGSGPVVILCGPGNNGGDGYVAARRLALNGGSVVIASVDGDARPKGASAARNWDRVVNDAGIRLVHLPVARDALMFGQGIDKAAVVVDALLGTGVRGALREPIRSAVESIRRAAQAGVPVVAVDTPTAVDLSSGEPSDPAVRADLTVTFHRPKTGLQTKRGAAYAGKVLVAPIGIPAEADRG